MTSAQRGRAATPPAHGGGRGGRRRSLGLRFTERFLLPFTGPAEVAQADRAGEVTDEQRARADLLGRELRRVTAADGRPYLVVADEEPDDDAPTRTPQSTPST
ncbi:hypothetical protein [Actinotalea sp. K2]|uniref:hypothetical protein n=1 Tax=Actinotalea sp. K2 TaxID=2939438 RepID=UPI0020182359|nr:hypothetical protein [Actinotalea sp. K2]MCL3859759.1 hypothetical protein [Actinotalea sp. K2]